MNEIHLTGVHFENEPSWPYRKWQWIRWHIMYAWLLVRKLFHVHYYPNFWSYDNPKHDNCRCGKPKP